ncbi:MULTISPECIES: restriction endonuclease subunit S [Pantoea]|uniref:restriction endonuclease subunit S n=1 Tax=Pantoea TaxID=53335 RepID=UPI000DE4B978|nr:restriction endonuclease subunit S [Pantoea sp. 3_1284]RBO15295.1 restriction endonuclease subunit S [Pantoea sp. 3_1284]
MSVDNKVPEIRFKGFSGAWEEKGLGTDVAEILGGGTPSTSISEFWDGDIDWYSPTEIGSNVYAEGSQKKITALGLKNSSAKILPADNTVLFTSRAGIGDMAILARPGATNQGFQSFIVKEGFSPYFIYSAGKQIKDFALKHASGSTFLEISGKQLGRMKILMPSSEEQIAIGNYFQKLDALINQHQKKYDKLSNIKKAMLEKMFPKQGETIPDIRFKGFSGEWEEKAICDLFTVTRGNVLSATKTSPIPTLYKRYPVYSSQTKNNGLMGFYDKYLFENAITWTTDGANAGTVNFRDGKFYSTNVNGVLLSDEGYANKAIAEILNKEAWRHVSHVGNPKLMNNVMSAIKITIPNSVEEQTAIGSYFQKLDNLINQHQQQITKLNNIKQACLNKMFV